MTFFFFYLLVNIERLHCKEYAIVLSIKLWYIDSDNLMCNIRAIGYCSALFKSINNNDIAITYYSSKGVHRGKLHGWRCDYGNWILRKESQLRYSDGTNLYLLVVVQ